MARLTRLEKTQGDAKAQRMMADLDGKGILLNIFRGLANSPAALDAYLKFSGALNAGELDARTREAIALAIGQANRCDYCLAAHTKFGAGAGLSEADINDARHGKSSDTKINAAVTLARTLLDNKGQVTDAQLATARSAGLTDGQIAEIVGHVALNVFTNYFNHVNQTEVDLPKVPLDLK